MRLEVTESRKGRRLFPLIVSRLYEQVIIKAGGPGTALAMVNANSPICLFSLPSACPPLTCR
jgi:hypothetical protein